MLYFWIFFSIHYSWLVSDPRHQYILCTLKPLSQACSKAHIGTIHWTVLGYRSTNFWESVCPELNSSLAPWMTTACTWLPKSSSHFQFFPLPYPQYCILSATDLNGISSLYHRTWLSVRAWVSALITSGLALHPGILTGCSLFILALLWIHWPHSTRVISVKCLIKIP